MTSPLVKSGVRILIAEDEPDTAQSLAELLALWGHQVKIATDGPTALARVISFQPGIVLLDIGLPKLNGWELARKIGEHGSERKPVLIAISGYGKDEDLQRSREAGIFLHLRKPVDPEQLAVILTCFQRLHSGG